METVRFLTLDVIDQNLADPDLLQVFDDPTREQANTLCANLRNSVSKKVTADKPALAFGTDLFVLAFVKFGVMKVLDAMARDQIWAQKARLLNAFLEPESAEYMADLLSVMPL